MEVLPMPRFIRLSFACLFLCLPILGLSTLRAQSASQTIDMPSGGRIVYGAVNGASSPSSAMLAILRMMHKNCGEKPAIGQAFRMKGTDAAGLYFTVVNHAAGNGKVAGLILASQGAPGQAALVFDHADRFYQTSGAMLQKLFTVWHPGNVASAFNPASAHAAPAARPSSSSTPQNQNPQGAPAARLRHVSLSDNSATVGIPDGWTLDPSSSHGMLMIKGPNGEMIGMGMIKTAMDPTTPFQRRMQQLGGKMPGAIYYPFRGNIVQEFPSLFQAWRSSNGKPPCPLKIDSIDPVQSAAGNHCALAKGQVDLDGHGMQFLSELMCAIDPNQYGTYSVLVNNSVVRNDLIDKERPTIQAIVRSMNLNSQVMDQQNQAILRQKQADDAATIQNAQQAVNRIHAIGDAATARMQSTEAANDAQHAGWWADQDSQARRNQGEDNYIRDQTVVRDTYYPDQHYTVYNNTGQWLQQTFPDRVEEVPPSQYIKGTDYF
jgi:hypothetical protein